MRYFIFLFLSMMAFNMADAWAQPTQPGPLILEISDHVLEIVQKAKTAQDPELFLQEELVSYLDPFIDFRSFAQGVMGKYRKIPTEEENQKFMHDFKQTLVKLYSKAMLAFNVKEIALANTANTKSGGAQVTMLITSAEDASFTVQYSLRKKPKEPWKVRNVVLDGVNLGLTYRNQFYSAVDNNQGDVAAAINNWSAVMNDTAFVQ